MKFDKIKASDSSAIIKEIKRNSKLPYDQLSELLNKTDTTIVSSLTLTGELLKHYGSKKTPSHLRLYQISCAARNLGYAGEKTEKFINSSFLQYLSIFKMKIQEFENMKERLNHTNNTAIEQKNRAANKIEAGIKLLLENGYSINEVTKITLSIIQSLPEHDNDENAKIVEEIDNTVFSDD